MLTSFGEHGALIKLTKFYHCATYQNINYFFNRNMPVHRWCARHLYIPLVESGYTRTTATAVVFFISAFFHEYLVSVPLKTFKVR